MTTQIDTDGMPLAPPEVLTAHEGAFVLFGPAMNQATSFHVPTSDEKTQMIAMLDAWAQSKTNGGPNAATTQIILANAKLLGLVACRVKYTTPDNLPASVLLFYTQPGKKDYSGPFMMLRETRASKFVIYGPHDDSDGTFAATKLGMINSYALACFSNGHKRGSVSGGDHAFSRMSDWCHAPSVDHNLGDVAIQHFSKQLFPGTVAIQFHGIADPHKCMFHSRNDAMGAIFKNTLIKNTRLVDADFVGYGVYFIVDLLVNTDYYIKCEIPAVIYEHNPAVVKDIAVAMELQPWCWAK